MHKILRGLAVLFIIAAGAGLLVLNGCADEPEGVTVAQFHKMDDEDSEALLKCQLHKYAHEVGKKKAQQYFMKSMEQAMQQKQSDIVPLQEQLIEDKGISCTKEEIFRATPEGLAN